MIKSEELIAKAETVPGLHQRVTSYVASVRAKVSDGLTVAEFCDLTLGGMRLAIACVDELSVDGPQKKQMVIDLAGSFFDEFGHLLVPPFLRPTWWLFSAAVRSLVLSLAAGAVEALLPLIRTEE